MIDAPAIEDAVTDHGKKAYVEFIAKYGSPRSTPLIFATTYEAFRVLDLAIQSGKDVRTYLSEGSFDGILGKWSFDQHGDPVYQQNLLIMKQIQDGKAVPIP